MKFESVADESTLSTRRSCCRRWSGVTLVASWWVELLLLLFLLLLLLLLLLSSRPTISYHHNTLPSGSFHALRAAREWRRQGRLCSAAFLSPPHSAPQAVCQNRVVSVCFQLQLKRRRMFCHSFSGVSAMLSRNESPQVSARFLYHTHTKGFSRPRGQTLFRTQCEHFVTQNYTKILF
jgi:hypothetical protein